MWRHLRLDVAEPGEFEMKKRIKRLGFLIIATATATLPSCTTGWLIPTRDAAVAGLSNFVTQTVISVLQDATNSG
jgi:hypothetical protein